MTDQTSADGAGGQADVDEGDAGPDEADAAEAADDPVADAQAAIDDARRRVAEAPAEVVIVNHVMGLYELAAIHLAAERPNLASASLAIDAVACLVDGLGDRLGPEAATMRDALNNIRLAFVQIKGQAKAPSSPWSPPDGDRGDPA